MRLHYECEQCGTIYPLGWQAALCESKVLPAAKYKVGDRIQFLTRYDGLESDLVIAVEIQQGPLCGPMSGWNDEAQFNERLRTMKSTPELFHRYGYRVNQEHQMGKDWHTNVIAEDAIKRKLKPKRQQTEQPKEGKQ